MTAVKEAEVHMYVSLPPRGFNLRTNAARSFEVFDPSGYIISGDGNTFRGHSIDRSVTVHGNLHGVALQYTAPAEMLSEIPVEQEESLRVLDSTLNSGISLVETSEETARNLNASGKARLVPVQYYEPAIVRPLLPTESPVVESFRQTIQPSLIVLDANSSFPITDVEIVAFTNYTTRDGVKAVSDENGKAHLKGIPIGQPIERLYLYPKSGYWSRLKENVDTSTSVTVSLEPIDLSHVDSLRFFYGDSELESGKGVMVGVIDTGIAPHKDLRVAGGMNVITNERPDDYSNDVSGHGTHVAGIISGRGTAPDGIRGVAPDATICSYRVFPEKGNATNFYIAKAIDQAVSDGCDLINLSLSIRLDDSNVQQDETLVEAIQDAIGQGCVVIAAAGNYGRAPVCFPACYSDVVAVSAMGRKGTFPVEATQTYEIAEPFGEDDLNFVAAFSNIGADVGFIAPGVGVISTYPNGYAVMDGTSMACPSVTGFAARLLSQRDDIRNQPRDKNRANAIVQMLQDSAKSLGFGREFEGYGLPR